MSSSSNAGPPKRRGQYSSRACNGCRRRRCKCDGVQPICGACSFYGRECEWSSETDARRPVTKQLVESLRVKIQVLEAEVEQLKNNKSLMTPGKSHHQLLDHSTSRATSPATSTGTSNNPVGIVHTPQDIKPIVSLLLALVVAAKKWLHSGMPPIPQLDYGEGMSDVERPPPPPSQFTTKFMYRYIFEIDESIPASERSKDLQMSLMCDWSRYLPPLGNITLSRHEHDTLLLRCFKYGTSWLLGLIPELFLHDMLYFLGAEESQFHSPPRLQHYTPLLHCSVLAFATAFSDDPVIRVPTTRGIFASWAKQWLDEEFKRPTMSLVRSLALIAEYHCGLGEREAGYMYMGMSFRAARALISSEENELWMNEGSIDFPESINRDWHFWSAFAHDKVMALEYKQDYDIPIPHPNISFPSVDSVLDNQPWPLEAPLVSLINATPPKLLTITFHESCKLMVIATQVISTILRQTQDIPEQHGVIINTHLSLDTWFNHLPENLLVWARSTSPLPHVITLHVSYWWLLIVLHRPFYQKDQPSDAEAKIPITDLSIKMCDRAAHKIVQLIKMFDEQHGLRFFPRNMVQAISDCGLALFKEFSWAPLAAIKKRANATGGVITCINALRTIAPTWPFAQKYAEELDSRLQEQRIPSFHDTNIFTVCPKLEIDSSAVGMLNDPSADQEMEDSADISTMFQQYMTQWGPAPLAQVYGPLQSMQALPSASGSETSQPNDMLADFEWEAKGSF